MLIYFCVLALCFVLASSKSNKHYWLIPLIFALLLVFRDASVGTDTFNYLNLLTESAWDLMASEGTSRSFEILWTKFIEFILDFKLSNRYLISVPAILNILILLYSYKKFQLNTNLCFFFYYILTFYFVSMNISRQCLAISIVLYAYYQMSYGNNKRFFFFVLFASLIHFSSIICVIVYFASKFKFKNRIKTLLILSTLIIGFIGLDLSFWDRLGFYSVYSDYLMIHSESSLNRIMFRVVISSCAIFLLNSNKVENLFISNLFLISICLDNIAVGTNPMITRIFFNFNAILPVYYTLYFQNCKSHYLKNKWFYILSLSYFTYFVNFLLINSANVVPYKLYF